MYSISANRDKIAYDVKKFVVDFETDIAELPTNCTPGSSAFVIENSSAYMLNNNRKWVKINLDTGNGGSSGGNGGSGDGDIIKDVIYDGGVI